MCLLFIAYNCTPRHRFVIAANRDEFHNRPTAPLGYRDAEKTILGGKDLQAGGMWLGVSRSGKFAALTNYRDGNPGETDQPSRGEIVYDYLRCQDSALNAMEDLAKKGKNYAGFNVLFGESTNLVYYSNKQGKVKILKPGFYGLSNHLLDTPWPKLTRGKELLMAQMCSDKSIDSAAITKLLHDENVPADDLLPDTGVGLALEKFLSPLFIDGEEYGTRSSAVVEIAQLGDVIFTETSYIHDSGGKQTQSLVRMGFDLED